MFGIGLPEMILILALALIVVGPDKLPELARSIAKGVMELKKTAEGLKEQMKEEGNPLDDIKPDLEDAAKTFKSQLLDHPERGRTELFPDKGVNPSPEESAAQALAGMKDNGVDTSQYSDDISEPVELSADDLTEVVHPSDISEPAETPKAPKNAPSTPDSSDSIEKG